MSERKEIIYVEELKYPIFFFIDSLVIYILLNYYNEAYSILLYGLCGLSILKNLYFILNLTLIATNKKEGFTLSGIKIGLMLINSILITILLSWMVFSSINNLLSDILEAFLIISIFLSAFIIVFDTESNNVKLFLLISFIALILLELFPVGIVFDLDGNNLINKLFFSGGLISTLYLFYYYSFDKSMFDQIVVMLGVFMFIISIIIKIGGILW